MSFDVKNDKVLVVGCLSLLGRPRPDTQIADPAVRVVELSEPGAHNPRRYLPTYLFMRHGTIPAFCKDLQARLENGATNPVDGIASEPIALERHDHTHPLTEGLVGVTPLHPEDPPGQGVRQSRRLRAMLRRFVTEYRIHAAGSGAGAADFVDHPEAIQSLIDELMVFRVDQSR